MLVGFAMALLALQANLLAKTRTRPLLGRPRLTPAAAAPAGRQAHWPQRARPGGHFLVSKVFCFEGSSSSGRRSCGRGHHEGKKSKAVKQYSAEGVYLKTDPKAIQAAEALYP